MSNDTRALASGTGRPLPFTFGTYDDDDDGMAVASRDDDNDNTTMNMRKMSNRLMFIRLARLTQPTTVNESQCDDK